MFDFIYNANPAVLAGLCFAAGVLCGGIGAFGLIAASWEQMKNKKGF